MSRQRIVRALKPRSSSTPESPALRFPLSENGGGVVNEDFGNAAAAAIGGTIGSFWTANLGWATPSSNSVNITDPSALAALEMSNLQQLIVGFELKVFDVSATAGNDNIMSYGRTTTNRTEGGFGILQLAQSGANIRLRTDIRDTAGVYVAGASSDALAVGEHSCLFEFNLSGLEPSGQWYFNGAPGGGAKTYTGVAGLPGIETTGGLVLFGRMGGTVIDEKMGSTVGLGTAIRNIFFIGRTEYDPNLSADLADEMNRYRFERLWKWDGK